MRYSYEDHKDLALDAINIVAWRVAHNKEQCHRDQVRKAYNSRPRLRRNVVKD